MATKAMMSDATGRHSDDTRADTWNLAHAYHEARAILSETERTERLTGSSRWMIADYTTTDSLNYERKVTLAMERNGSPAHYACFGAIGIALVESIAAFVAADDPAEWLRGRQ